MNSSSTLALAGAPPRSDVAPAFDVLRVGAALCFIGHGAFGFIGKEGWLPYFAVAGIPPRWAWGLMPWIGAVDVLAGMAVLFAPRRLPLIYMAVWGAWTALLRPLAGESVFEAVERAGNYGVPLALLLLVGLPRSWGALMAVVGPAEADPRARERARAALRWTTCLLLAGHGALGALVGKPLLAEHYLAVGLPGATTGLVGWFEIGLAGLVAASPHPALLAFVAAWKLATESLFLVSGAPVWEFVERAGSYAAPLALALLAVPVRPSRAARAPEA